MPLSGSSDSLSRSSCSSAYSSDSDSEESSAASATSEDDSDENCDKEPVDLAPGGLVDNTEKLLYVNSDKSVDEAVYDFLSDYFRHKETQACLKDHLKTFLKYLPTPNRMPKTVK